MKLHSKYIILLLGILLILATVQSALAIEISAEPVKKAIDPGESAKYIITVTNDGDKTKDYTIDSPDFRWRLRTDPLSDYFSGFTLTRGSSKEITLSLTPAGDIFYGIYGVILDVSARDGESKSISVPVEYVSPYPSSLEYAPTVVVDGFVNGNGKIDPRAPSVLVLELDNRNPLNISSLEVSIASDFINQDFTTKLGPLEKKKIEFNFNIDPQELPRVEQIVVTLRYNNKTLTGTPKSLPVQVISYSQILRNPTEESDLLRTKVRKTVFLKNEGNVDNRDALRIKTSFFKRIFTSTSPKPIYERDETGFYAVWDVELAPASTAEIIIEVNYRPIFYVLGLSIIGAILYFLMRSPVLVKKTSVGVHSDEGGISEMKVLIHIQNRTNNAYKSFSISEHIPKFATYKRSDMLGSIQPSKVLSHERKGALLKWNFEAIEPFEERIIIYKVQLNLTVLGNFSMPATVVKFKDDSNGNYSVSSNKLRMNHLNEEIKESHQTNHKPHKSYFKK